MSATPSKKRKTSTDASVEDIPVVDLTDTPPPSSTKVNSNRRNTGSSTSTNDTPSKRGRKSSKSNAQGDSTDDNNHDVVDMTGTSRSSSSNQVKPTAKSICSVVSYNLWFGPPHPNARMSALAEIVASHDPLPLFVGMQEVTPTLAQTLFPLLESVGYQMVVQPDIMASGGYGCAVAFLPSTDALQILSTGFLPYQSTIMARGIMWVKARLLPTNAIVLFATTHLESFLPKSDFNPQGQYTGVTQRKQQAEQLREFCQTHDNDVDIMILTGDWNWDDERKRSSVGIDSPLLGVLNGVDDDDAICHWIDAWHNRRPGEDGYTYDSKESAMLKGNLRRRFDRCLIRTGRQQAFVVNVKDTELIGKDPISDLMWTKKPHPLARNRSDTNVPVLPSDHFGLRVTMEYSKQAASG